jgi:hypothetical protein
MNSRKNLLNQNFLIAYFGDLFEVYKSIMLIIMPENTFICLNYGWMQINSYMNNANDAMKE